MRYGKTVAAICAALVASAISLPAQADPAMVVDVRAQQTGDTWRFDVSVLHPDTGWDHYADGWSVFAPDGTELGYRELLHPHENEQPFTRSLSGVQIPPDLTEVIVRARCSVDGWSDEGVTVTLER